MKNIKLFTLLIIILTFVLSSFTISLADEILTQGDYRYIQEEFSVTIVEYIGNEKTVVVPPTINGYPVTRVMAGSFVEKGIVQLTLPGTLQTADFGSFDESTEVIFEHYTKDDPNETSVVIPDNTAPAEKNDVSKEGRPVKPVVIWSVIGGSAAILVALIVFVAIKKKKQ